MLLHNLYLSDMTISIMMYEMEWLCVHPSLWLWYVYVVVWSVNDSLKVSIFVCHVKKYRYRMYRYYMFLFGSNCKITCWFSVRNLYTVYIHVYEIFIKPKLHVHVFLHYFGSATYWQYGAGLLLDFLTKERVWSAYMYLSVNVL